MGFLLPELQALENTRVGITNPTWQQQPASTSYQFQQRAGIPSSQNTGVIGAPSVQSSPSTGGGGGGDSRATELQKMASSGGLNPVQQAEYDALMGVNSRENQIRGEINSGYDSYFSSLDDILNNGLPQQQTAQTNIANSQYDQGVNTLDLQKTQGVADLNKQRSQAEQSQSKTLNDLASNLRNSFMAGNVYLGARGAGDSSAANQYSYALTKLGSQQRGDVTSQFNNIQNDINDRESRLGEIYNSQVKDLGFQRDQQINSIAQWFAEQQNALKQAKAQGQLSKSQDLASLSQNLLNVALQRLQTVQTEAANKRSALEQWAMNNSQNISQLKQNMGQVSQVSYNMPTAQPILRAPQVSANGSLFAPAGYGGSDEKRRDIFGRPI